MLENRFQVYERTEKACSDNTLALATRHDGLPRIVGAD